MFSVLFFKYFMLGKQKARKEVTMLSGFGVISKKNTIEHRTEHTLPSGGHGHNKMYL